MMLSPHSTLGRLAAVSILFSLLAVLWLGCFAPLLEAGASKREEADLMQSRLQKMDTLVQQGIPQDLPQTDQASVLQAQSPAGAQAALQGIVRSIALNNKINLRSIASAPSASDEAGVASILLSGICDLEALVTFLYRIDTYELEMWARDLNILAERTYQEDRQDVVLELRMIIDAPWGSLETGGAQ